jgi:hypothetical protein
MIVVVRRGRRHDLDQQRVVRLPGATGAC